MQSTIESKTARQTEGIDLYIRYTYLPIRSYSEMIKSISDIYEAVTIVYFPIQLPGMSDDTGIRFSRIRDMLFPFAPFYFPPLCLLESHTGSSIKDWITFDPAYKNHYDQAGDYKMYLPRWSAAIAATSSVLVAMTLGGQKIISNQLGIQKDKLELVKDSLINEKTKLEIEQLRSTLNEHLEDNESSLGSKLRSSVENFKQYANQEYIREIQIDGITIHSK
jgi:hypothetical protein